MNQRTMLMVGTKKGAFVFESEDGRRTWRSSGPHFAGTEIYHVVYDPRSGTIYAAVDSFVWGPTVARSSDRGRSWKESKKAPKFPKGGELSVEKVWHIEPANDDEPGVLYCGTAPAAIFRSEDGGDTWTLNRPLFKHETRQKWVPGFGGLCLHSILIHPKDPKSRVVAISSVGIMKTTDGGRTWGFRNKNLLADFLPPKHQYPEFGQCPHHLVRHPARPELVYQQSHSGVYRSDNYGETWVDISKGLPSRFGFGIAVDHNDPKRVYVSPLGAGDARIPPDKKFLVWCSEDSGRSWSPLGAGLPRRSYYNVLREGMAADTEESCGIYFGTTTGQLYGSRNQGRRWELIADGLPPIYSVSAT